jgi:hypothetical protein
LIKDGHPGRFQFNFDQDQIMRRFLSIVSVALLFFASSFINQPKQAKFEQFNNFSGKFEVPEGKSWLINQVFASYAVNVKTDANGSTFSDEIRIYMKTLNGDIKTDFQGKRFGPQLYQSSDKNACLSYPILLPEKTTFSLIILEGKPGNCKRHDGTGYISYYEISNE